MSHDFECFSEPRSLPVPPPKSFWFDFPSNATTGVENNLADSILISIRFSPGNSLISSAVSDPKIGNVLSIWSPLTNCDSWPSKWEMRWLRASSNFEFSSNLISYSPLHTSILRFMESRSFLTSLFNFSCILSRSLVFSSSSTHFKWSIRSLSISLRSFNISSILRIIPSAGPRPFSRLKRINAIASSSSSVLSSSSPKKSSFSISESYRFFMFAYSCCCRSKASTSAFSFLIFFW